MVLEEEKRKTVSFAETVFIAAAILEWRPFPIEATRVCMIAERNST